MGPLKWFFFLFVRQRDCQQGRPERWHAASSRSDDSAKTSRAQRADPVSHNMLFFHRVTDVEIKRGWAERHAPATRSCAGRQTSVQWHPPLECLAGARSRERGCRCSLWSQPSGVNLARHGIQTRLCKSAQTLSVGLRQRSMWKGKVNGWRLTELFTSNTWHCQAIKSPWSVSPVSTWWPGMNKLYYHNGAAVQKWSSPSPPIL